ncbi:MAG: hypothetical protein PHE17_03150 [Thiothrix sp.]|jgi:hypothetical protein|uniref:hypothetical protein n=1 Tax=Thiothrix sp. TaxID=1032 RepID=UPI00262C84CA|nr:hypothetical protein [Thiothrix sp.]MDD5391996.1 hypothetical protein [Thiothrix sp.]
MKVTLIIVCASFSMLSLQGCGGMSAAGNPVPASICAAPQVIHPLDRRVTRGTPERVGYKQDVATVDASQGGNTADNMVNIPEEQAPATDTAGRHDNMRELVINGLFMLASKCVEFGHCGL